MALAALAHGIESGGIIVLDKLDELVVDDGCWWARHIFFEAIAAADGTPTRLPSTRPCQSTTTRRASSSGARLAIRACSRLSSRVRCKATKPLYIHIRGKLEDLPTFPTAMHASPNCASTSDFGEEPSPTERRGRVRRGAARGLRYEKTVDYVLDHIIRIAHDQRTRELRPGIRNRKLGSTFEQPHTSVCIL